jgi:pimeloyl-ACP methyl ester carboxylesterase
MQQRPEPKGWHRTSPELLAYYESKLLSHLSVSFKVYPVSLRNNKPELRHLCNEFINTLELLSSGDMGLSHGSTVVVLHGFASAMATFVNIFEPIGKACKKLYAIDLLGFGRSSKPVFPTGCTAFAFNLSAAMTCRPPSQAIRAELQSYCLLTLSKPGACRWGYVQLHSVHTHLERTLPLGMDFWFYILFLICLRLNNTHHSYAHKYPHAVEALILCDPWGFPPLQSSQCVSGGGGVWVGWGMVYAPDFHGNHIQIDA